MITPERIALSDPAGEALAEYADFEIYMLIDGGAPQDSNTIRRVGTRLVGLADLADAAEAGEVALTQLVSAELDQMRARAAEDEREPAAIRARLATFATTGCLGKIDEDYLAAHPEVERVGYCADVIAGWDAEAADYQKKAAGTRTLLAEVTS